MFYFITSLKHEMKILTLPAIYASLKAFLIKVNFLDASDHDTTWSVKADLAFKSFMFRKCNVPENQVTIPKHIGEVHPVILAHEEWEYLDHLEVEEDTETEAEVSQEDTVSETVEDTVETVEETDPVVMESGSPEANKEDQPQQPDPQVQEPVADTESSDNTGIPESEVTAEDQVSQDSDKGE